MVIDIDIKIANSDGKLVHRFSKRFDEKSEAVEQINNAGLSKDFEEFLSEYLSASGRSIRERLINYPEVPSYNLNTADMEEEEGLSGEENSMDGYADSEMEYKIRIGNNKVIAGKIPFHRLSRLNAVTDALNRAAEDNYTITNQHGKPEPSYYAGIGNGTAGSFTEHNTDFILNSRNKETAGDLEKNLKNLMIQAVEKYESSFYHMGEEETT